MFSNNYCTYLNIQPCKVNALHPRLAIQHSLHPRRGF